MPARSAIFPRVCAAIHSKTKTKLRLEVVGELKKVLERIQKRPRRITTLWLLQGESARLTQSQLRTRFEKARAAAGVDFQFRDLRGKAATDLNDLAAAQKLLGHSGREMTEHYVKAKAGERVAPVLRRIVDKSGKLA